MEYLHSIQSKNGICASTIKLIALVTMLIDHIGATIVLTMIGKHGVTGANKAFYYFLRGVGRLAFPLYIFLLLQGFEHTRNRVKYLSRLFAFALISEIPFDLAFMIPKEAVKSGHIVESLYQNVFFTLCIGLIAIMLIDEVHRRYGYSNKATVLVLIIVISAALLGDIICCDYGLFGVLAIIVAYKYRDNLVKQMIMICIVLALSNPVEAVALIDVILIRNYNGKKGLNVKWLFYLFYPVHLLLLWGIMMFL